MKTSYLRLIVSCLVVFISLHTSAQQLWREEPAENQSVYLNRNAGYLPQQFKLFSLDARVLRARIAGARAYRETGNVPTTDLQIPLSDGSFISADLYESSVLSPALQAIIPNVKTYVLVDKISKGSRGRVTITDNGITGLIFTDKGTAYINPVSNTGNRVHMTYFTSDLHTPIQVACGVKDVTGYAGRGDGLSRIDAGDCHLRTYRLAVAATGEYTTWAGGTKAQALTYITTTINDVNAIYERDATIHFNLVTNNSIIYTDPTTDPYPTVSFPDGTTLANNNSFTDANLGSSNYDIGIVFNNGWNGGLAQLSSVCTTSHGDAAAGLNFGTGANPTAGPQGPIFSGTVAHEMGHQFSATHTMASNNGSCSGNNTAATAYEPGGGSTIMAYAGSCTGNSYQNNSDLYFHVGSVAQILNYAVNGNGNNCPVNTSISNIAPTVTVNSTSYTIPISTPFFLTCTASDANANSLTYTWEQMDANAVTGFPPSPVATTGPNFRSFPPTANPTRYLPNLASIVSGTAQTYEVLPSVTRSMSFRVNVRDNAAGGGCNAQADVSVNTNSAAGPFTVSSQSSATSLTANGANTFTITWNVASTNSAPINCSNVDILFSADGGANFNYTLLSNTANDGTETITVPNIVTSAGRIMVRSVGNIFFNVNTANITITSSCNAEGAVLSPSATVSASPGSATLNLSSAPAYGAQITSFSGTVNPGDPNSTLAVFNPSSTGCSNFGNQYKYNTFSFQVNASGTYTFSGVTDAYIVNVYNGSFVPGSPCTNFVASNGMYNGSAVNISSSFTAPLLAGIAYTLTVGTFASGTPTVPFSYSITPSGPGNAYAGYPNPGVSYSYNYVIVNNATGDIAAISSTPDLSNATNFPTGTYTVYGFSYLTANFSAGTLSGYVGGLYSTLTNDLFNSPGTRCGNISKNNVTVNIFVVLPISMLPLTAARENQQVRLYWATETEVNSRNFEVQRSGDGVNFTTITSIGAAGNSSSRINYTLLDPSPLPDKNFYRIKAFDAFDKYVYSNVALVKTVINGFDIKMYPNPVRDQCTLEILAAQNGTATLEITNSTGSLVSRKVLTWQKGLNVETIDMGNFASGIYHIKISSATQVATEKVVKL